MSDAYENQRGLEFGDFVLNTERGALLREGEEIKLRPRSYEVLRYLVEHAGSLVSRQDLLDEIWQGAVVTDDAVTQCLIDVRKALGDSSQEIIRTVPRRGYIFELPVAVFGGQGGHKEEKANRNWTRALWIAVPALALALFAFLPDSTPDPGVVYIPVTEPEHPAIAVLPFAVLSTEQDQAYFADGVSEEILNQLAMHSDLRVIARTSSFSFRGGQADVKEIAEQLGVTHVLEGSFRKANDSIRMDVKLIDARSGEYLWSEKFDRTLSATGLFAIQDEIADSVVESIESEFSLGIGSLRTRIPTENLEALDAYYAGRMLMETRNADALAEATEKFKAAIALDGEFALAYAALADSYRLQNNYGDMPREVSDELGRQAVESALSINPELGEAHTSLANLLVRSGDYRKAEEAFLQSIQLNPNYAPAYQWYGEFLGLSVTRSEEGVQYARMAVALDPMSAIINRDYARALSSAGRNDEALEQLDITIGIDPDFSSAYFLKGYITAWSLGQLAEGVRLLEISSELDTATDGPDVFLSFAYIDLDDLDQARATVRRMRETSVDNTWALLAEIEIQVAESRTEEIRESSAELLQRWPDNPYGLRYLRDVLIAAGESDLALDYYKQARPELFEESGVGIRPEDWQIAIDLAFLLKETGRVDHAETLLGVAESAISRMSRLGWTPYGIGDVRISAIRGDVDAALDALEEAIDAGWRESWRASLDGDLALAPLRELDRFRTLRAHLAADVAEQRRILRTQGYIAEPY